MQDDAPLPWAYWVYLAVARLDVLPYHHQRGHETATGFFWRQGENVFLVTNAHVVFGDDYSEKPEKAEGFHVEYSTPAESSLHSVSLGSTSRRHVRKVIDLEDAVIHVHENKRVDLAAILLGSTSSWNVCAFTEVNVPANYTFLPGQDLAVMGYPTSFGDHVNKLPVARRAAVATHYEVDYNGDPLFLTDGVMLPGMSGSPVLLVRMTGSAAPAKQEPVTSQSFLLGVHSAENFFDQRGAIGTAHLNNTWYSRLIKEILDDQGRAKAVESKRPER